MKVMKNILKSVFVLILLSAFVSCGNFFSEKNSGTNAEEAKTILKISVENNLSARTITPDNSEGILSDFVLKGKKANTTKEPEEIARAENISELNALTIVFDNKDTGEWEFILTGQYTIGTDENQQTIRFTSEQTVEIKKNQMNSVSFKLRNEDLPYGGLNLTVQFADETNTVSRVVANLYNDDFTVDETIEFTTSDFEQTAQQGVKKISIIKNLTDSSRLPADCYQLELYFYTSEKGELNSILCKTYR